MSFNLADVLKDVSNSGTNQEQIEYIPRERIDLDPNNFYQLSNIDALADNIATCGLQQPIRVRPNPDQEGRYIIVSGHRRFSTVDLLAKDDPERWRELPCIIERDNASPALQQLRLIYANANTRAMTSAELGEQAAQVEKLLYQLKEEGYEFPGRMRDHVAEAVKASKSKLARLKVIRENLAECWQPLYQKNETGESVAYALAQMPGDWQKIIFDSWGDRTNRLYEYTVKKIMERMSCISKMPCSHKVNTKTCDHKEVMFRKSVANPWNDTCLGCCMDCLSLHT